MMKTMIDMDDAAALQRGINGGISADACLDNGQTLLQYATEKGARDCVRMLLYLGADANLSHRGLRPLGLAALHGHASIMESLLAGGVDLSPISTGNAMITAARAGHADCVRLLLEMDNADDMKLEALRTALFHERGDCGSLLAAEWGHYAQNIEGFYETIEHTVRNAEVHDFARSETVRALIQSAPPPGTVNQAVMRNDQESLKRMLSEGANPASPNIWGVGNTLLDIVDYGKDPALASLLVQAGADPYAMGVYDDDEIETLFPWLLDIGGEPLSILAAVRRNDVAALRRMLAEGAEPDKPLSEDFSTPLTVALKLGHTRCAELLVLASACLYARDLWKNSPLRLMMCSHEFAD